MSEDRKGFIVNDRRHFAPDGSARTEEEDARADEAVTSRPPAATEAPLAGAGPGDAVEFGSFLISLAGQASVLLGLATRDGEKPRLDLAGARSIIAVLEMLQSKTEGRRTPEESELLEGLLYELRMAYVSRTRSGA
jgi:hypothetical protein